VPPAFTKDAVFEAIENGIKLVVIVTERIPRGDVAEMVELAGEHGDAATVGYATAAELERRYGISRGWFYAHKDELGAVRMGSGKRPRLRFDRALVEARLSAPLTSRSLEVPTHLTPAKVRAADVPVRYRNFILIRRSSFRLQYFHDLRLARSYPIAVGQQGLETPAGLYEVQGKETNPYWHVPDSAWAGDKAGQLVPPGPDNPIKARWLGFNGGAGIHGTEDVGSLGQAASHGCVRMAIPDVIDLYRRVPVHTPVKVE
jgi:lipoprotein-anchoring transpeptidase ErfK/SrfK